MVNLSTQNWPKAPLNILSEASGSLGDLGTLVPLLAALTANGQISLPASLLFGGIFNIATGLFYDLPMCVQPMKSIAAIALLSNMSDKQISGAGLSVGIAVGLLALFGGIDWLGKNVPIVLVRGIQLGTGLILLQKACALIISSHRWSFAGYDWMDNYLVAILAFLLILLLFNSSNNLSAIAIIALALAFARIRVSYTHADLAAIGTSFVPPRLLPWADIWIGFSAAGLGQIPLTVLNSVLAVSVLAKDLYPERTAPSSKSVALSVACMNISGGLAAQHRFGARSGLSMVILGTLKIITGVFFSPLLAQLFVNAPTSLIGVLLGVAGLQLCAVTVDLGKGNQQELFMVAILVAATVLGFANDGIGFMVGVVALSALAIGRRREGTGRQAYSVC